jgi:ubiquitin carboxyl-terminal hydrolase L3
MGLIHCTLNSQHADPSSSPPVLEANSTLSNLRTSALRLAPEARARLISDSPTIEAAHATAAIRGSTTPPPLGADPGHAFIAFVKGADGALYEMDGGRKGAKKLVDLAEDEDLLCEKALEAGPRPYLRREMDAAGENGVANVNFGCCVLVRK